MEKYKNYLTDIITLIIQEIELLENEENDDFTKGQKLAYYNIISDFKAQAILFDIDLEEIGLNKIDESNIL